LLCAYVLDSLFLTLNEDERNQGLEIILLTMVEQLKSRKSERILALQAIETLKTSTGDDFFGQRI